METASELSVRLSKASVKQLWDVYSEIEWPERLDLDRHWGMAPELCSLYGTEAWDSLDERQRKSLSLYEMGNLFSFTLQGERPLVAGLTVQMYSRQDSPCTEYLHHFLDEENKHMVMFAEFCNRYLGKVYRYKKVTLPRKYAKGEEDVMFFIQALVVEELGDVYNVAMQRDERLFPVVQQINFLHHRDEARHIVFGRRRCQEFFEEHSPNWSRETLDGLRAWIPDYLRSAWTDFYNPVMYKDAGIEDPYAVREAALASPVCREHRERVSAKLVDYFLEARLLLERPRL